MSICAIAHWTLLTRIFFFKVLRVLGLCLIPNTFQASTLICSYTPHRKPFCYWSQFYRECPTFYQSYHIFLIFSYAWCVSTYDDGCVFSTTLKKWRGLALANMWHEATPCDLTGHAGHWGHAENFQRETPFDTPSVNFFSSLAYARIKGQIP